VQPNGPYRVAGFCVGGVVAYEMARQLQQAGETVQSLVLIDSTPVNAQLRHMAPVLRLLPGANATQRLSRQAEVLRRLRWAHGRVAYFNALPKGTKSPWIVDKVVHTIPRIIGRKLRPHNKPAQPEVVADVTHSAPATDTADDLNRDTLVLRTQARAASAYLPGRFKGQIDFVFAEGAPGFERRNNPVNRWRMLADNVRMFTIASGHISLITNNLPMLAQTLRDAFGETRAE
jgi:thioesterase domain-containing protein